MEEDEDAGWRPRRRRRRRRRRPRGLVLAAAAAFVNVIFSPTVILKAADALEGSSEPFSPFAKSKSVSAGAGQSAKCFCELEGVIDDCLCSVDTVDYFNNARVHPRLQALLARPYFRYFQYNARKPCPFWRDDAGAKCAAETCSVRPCGDDEVPPGLKGAAPAAAPANHNKYAEEAQQGELCEAGDDDGGGRHEVDGTISDEGRADLAMWAEHDSGLEDFCEVDAPELCPDCDFVDLTLNPERYTGYSGEAARRVWRSIYEENCFKPEKASSSGSFFVHDSVESMCLEKRVFYRAISGLHASITIHLCANHPGDDGGKNKNAFLLSDKDRFSPNLDEFERRFDPASTNGQGPYWLRNLYFVYLLELRALTKAAPYLEDGEAFFTGRPEEDADTRTAVRELMSALRSFPAAEQFDETQMFSSDAAAELKLEFRDHFRNVSRIMDCVGCDKCKLWGKLQVTGLGTAFKILFADVGEEAGEAARDLKLSRNEIVALFNAFGRISTSISQLEKFRKGLG